MGRWARLVLPRTYMDRQRRAGFLFVLPAIAYFTAVYFVPLVESLVGSFYRTLPGGASRFVGLRLYELVFTDSAFWNSVWNTVKLLALSVPATVVLALAVALGLDRLTLRWRSLWAAMYFVPFAVSLVAAALIWQWIYDPVYGVLNHALSLVGLRHDDLPRRPPGDPARVRRGRGDRRGHRAPAAPSRHAAAPQSTHPHGVHPRADLQLQDLRPGVCHDPGRARRREPDDHPAPLRHRVQVLPPRRGLGHGGVRLRGPARRHARAVAHLPQAG